MLTFDRSMAASGRVFSPLSLQQHCLLYVVCRLEEFLPAYLALLPSKMRQELLLSLPALDVCQLEQDPGYSDGLDLDAVWKELYRSRQGNFEDSVDVGSLSRNPDQREGQWKEEYFRLAVGLALHYFSGVCEIPESTVYMHLFFDLLLTVRSPLGIEEWPWLDCSPFYSSNMIHGNTLITLRNFRELPASSSEALALIVNKCCFYPCSILIIMDEFVQSDVWMNRRDEFNLSLIKSLLQKVEIIRFSSEKMSPSAISDIPHFFLKTILSLECPVLHGLVVSDCSCCEMDHIISSCAHLFVSHEAYSGLRNLMLSPKIIFRNRSISSSAAEMLAGMLENQNNLSSLSLCSLNPYQKREKPSKGFAKLYAALSGVLRQPKMGVLGLGGFSLPVSAVQDMLFNFFTTENSDTHGVIIGGLTLVSEANAPHCDPGLVNMTDLSLETKQCSFLETDIPLSLCTWLFSSRRLRFKLFEMNAVALEESDPVSLVAQHPDFEATQLIFSQIFIPNCCSSQQAIEKILCKHHLQQFTLRNLDNSNSLMVIPFLSHITNGLMKQRDNQNLQYLNISENCLGYEEDSVFQLFIETVASLPQVQTFELHMSANSLCADKCHLLHRAWLSSARGKKLKLLDLRHNRGASDPSVASCLAADVAVTLLL